MKTTISEQLKDVSWWLRFKTWCLIKLLKLIHIRWCVIYPQGQYNIMFESGEVLIASRLENKRYIRMLQLLTHRKTLTIDLYTEVIETK